ncbi:hypothetical protein ACUOAQ_33160, partial [Escherichia sp. SP-MK]
KKLGLAPILLSYKDLIYLAGFPPYTDFDSTVLVTIDPEATIELLPISLIPDRIIEWEPIQVFSLIIRLWGTG